MITLIAALTKNRVIGKDNSLLWHIPEDLKNFKQLTSGNVVIMGRKTYDSLPEQFRPLPHRQNIIVSKSMPFQEGIDVCRNIEEAIATAQLYGKEIFVIGGAAIYEQMLPYGDRMILSYIKNDYEGDAYFPLFEEKDWREESRTDFAQFELVVYQRSHHH